MQSDAGARRARFFVVRPPALTWALPMLIVIELGGSTFGAPLGPQCSCHHDR